MRRTLLVAFTLCTALGSAAWVPRAEAGCHQECTFLTDCDQLSGDERWRCVANRSGSSGDICQTICRPSHGAIAYSPETGSWGYSYDYDSEARAGKEAVRRCKTYAADCKVVLSLVDQCGALAETKEGQIGTGLAETRADAEQRSLDVCGKNGAPCTIVAWVCSGV